jgi:DNA-binding transcriptional MerR regulator
VTTHTIGEVLNRLKTEFDDITISKIRFLEAEGLINPDRTESGYRKFSEGDVDRLRYVLRAQRDRYLPLKVIKDELDRIDEGLPVHVTAPDAPAGGAGAAIDEPGDDTAGLLSLAVTDVSLAGTELADAAGLEVRRLHELIEHGLLPDRDRFDGNDLRAAKVLADLLASGLEPRHLRMFTQFADREVALIEQLVSPLLRQRNPDSRRTANDRAERLAERADQLHRILLGRRLREMLTP